MSADDEARAEAYHAAWKAGAEWQASRPITDEQVEAAAKALMRGVEDGLPDWIDDLTEQIREYWRDEARTALEAARGVQS